MASPIINIKFLADLAGFSSSMQNADRKLASFSKKLTNTGKSLSLGLTAPLLALGVTSIKNFDKQAKAVAQVEQGLLSTGNAAGFSSQKLQEMASAIQNNSLFGDEEILGKVTAQLLTFTNIAGKEFDRTQLAAADLATRLGGDLQSATIQLGKALNDPVANLSALSRSGIQFSKSQKTLINSLVATGDMAGAQSLILDELEKQYGGSAAAAAAAGSGPLKQLSNILGDITEDFGKIIIEGIQPFINYLKEIALKFGALSPETKKFIVILGGIAAAIGPLLVLAGTILPLIGTGFAFLTGPIGIVVALLTAIGVIIYKNWAPIKRTLVDIANYFVDLYNESFAFRVVVEGIATAFKNVYAVGQFVFKTLGNIIALVAANIKTSFKNLGDILKAVLTGDIDKLPGLFAKNFSDSFGNVKEFIENSKAEFEGLQNQITGNIKDGIENALSGKKYKLSAENVDVDSVENKVSAAVQKGLADGGSGGGVGGVEADKYDAEDFAGIDSLLVDFGANYDTSAADAVASNFAQTLADAIETDGSELDNFTETVDEFEARMLKMQNIAEIVGDSVGNAFSDMANGFVESLGLADTGFQGFVKSLAQTAIKLISILLAESIALSIKGGAASGAATGAAAIFTTPAFISTAIAGVMGAFAAIPKFETGGIVGGSSFYGDKILARVNSGELILNQDQQRNLAGMMATQGAEIFIPETRLRGEDIVISYNRTNRKNERIG
tara:strand:- start:5524 stop:7707 length:2184 start_codon:yes stop_codon:yes gene_type:complete